MADSEEPPQETAQPEPQEEPSVQAPPPTAAESSEPPPPKPETADEHHPQAEPAPETHHELKIAPEPTDTIPEPIIEDREVKSEGRPSKEDEFGKSFEESRQMEAAPEAPRRSSTGSKRISTSSGPKMSVNQDTFMPPEIGGAERRSSERRTSGSRRISLPAADSKSPGPGRKSRFGMLSSKARMVLGSIVDIKSNVVEGYDKKVARYQNTYKLESDNPFNPEKVDKILKEVMHEVLENLQYNPEKCASAAKYASTQIRTKVKQLEFDRYKIICIVSIGEKNSQDVFATCRFLWDPDKDRYSCYSLENTYVFAIAHCFGLYYE